MLIKIEEKFRIDCISTIIYDRVFPKEFVFNGEVHDFWEIVYVVSGKIEVVENDEIYLLSDGDMIFHAPMEFHRIRAAEDTSPHVLNMSFTAEGTLPANLKDGIFALDSEQSSTYMKLFRFTGNDFLKNGTSDAYKGLEAANRLSSFILHLCSNTEAQETVSTTSSALTYKKLVKLMNKEVNSGLALQDFADKSFISISYIKTLFQRYAGISPKTYYNRLRLTQSQRLLSQEMSVSSIAEKMNFSSPNHFIRFFKSNTGMTPLQYKKQSLQKTL